MANLALDLSKAAKIMGQGLVDKVQQKREQEKALAEFEQKQRQQKLDFALKVAQNEKMPEQARKNAWKVVATEYPELGEYPTSEKQGPAQQALDMFGNLPVTGQKNLLSTLGLDENADLNKRLLQAKINAQEALANQRNRGKGNGKGEKLTTGDQALWDEMQNLLMIQRRAELTDKEKARLKLIQDYFKVPALEEPAPEPQPQPEAQAAPPQEQGPGILEKIWNSAAAGNMRDATKEIFQASPLAGMIRYLAPQKKTMPSDKVQEISTYISQQAKRARDAGIDTQKAAQEIDKQLRNKYGFGLSEFGEMRKNAR